MKTILLSVFIALHLPLMAQTDTLRHEVLLETTEGNIRLALYNETPLHRDNFIKLVKTGYYDGNLFHRVISGFMIQSGDSTSRHAQPNDMLGMYSPDYTIPAEIRYPQIFHKRGSLAAAREGDEVNPEHASSASQFYIVYGKRFNDDGLDMAQYKLNQQTGNKVQMTEDVREAYKKYGGTPHLDGQYTVFGEVVEGLDVVRDIQWTETDGNSRPTKDIRIIKATMVK